MSVNIKGGIEGRAPRRLPLLLGAQYGLCDAWQGRAERELASFSSGEIISFKNN